MHLTHFLLLKIFFFFFFFILSRPTSLTFLSVERDRLRVCHRPSGPCAR
jgi:hypothetical protein